MIDQQSRTWNMTTLQTFIHPMEILRISRIEIPALHTKDSLAWLPNKYENFSVQYAYKFA